MSAAIEHWVERFRCALEMPIVDDSNGTQRCMQIFALHKVLTREPSLYVQVSDALAERGILTRQSLKDVVTRAKELGAGR